MTPVKQKGTRAERARQTRRRMLESARNLFLSQGYSETTMAQIAEGAGVAVQTLYYTFQTKGKLLIEVVEVVAAGSDNPVPVPQRAWFLEMMASTDAQRILALVVDPGSAIYERVAVLWPVIESAVSDPDVAAYWQGVASGRRRGQRAIAERVAELGRLKPELTVERATDLLFLLGGHAPYRALVEDGGWPMADYQAWLFTSLVQQLLDDAVIDPSAVADRAFASRVHGQ